MIETVCEEVLEMMYKSFPPHEFTNQVPEEIYKFDTDPEICKHQADNDKFVPKRLCKGVPEAMEL